MRSFKQFLKESQQFENKGPSSIKLNINFFIDSLAVWHQDIPNIIADKAHLLDFNIKSTRVPDGTLIIVNKKLTGDFDTSIVNDVMNKVKSLHESFENHLKPSNAIVSVKGFPTHRIIFPDGQVDINVDAEGSTIQNLKDIYKFIECKKLFIWGSYAVKSTVLGILKIKGLQQFKYDPQDVNDNENWQEIVQKHVATKDILQCQEDLIDAGLAEHAKL